MKQVVIEGFTFDSTPDTKPAICVFGEENVGKSRFGCTAPHDDGLIGWLALDRNSKEAVDTFKARSHSNHMVVNAKPFMTQPEAVKIAMSEDPKVAKAMCTEIIKRVFDQGMKLAGHKDIESVVVDDGSQLFDWILFSHFGRRNQIESFQRGAPNNDFIEFVNAFGSKNLVMICRGAEVWADTGEVDVNGRKKPTSEDIKEALKEKYRARVITCKGDTLLEGQDLAPFGVCGEDITWDNVMMVINAKG